MRWAITGPAAELVFAPTADGLEDARRATAESARYNIGAMRRTLNVPTIALMFLRPENQARAEFTLGGPRYGKTPLVVLRSKETNAARLIGTPDNAAVTGLFWVEPQTGRIEHSELTINSKMYSAKVVVDYADQPKLGLWVPTRMTEEYAVTDAGSYAGDLSAAERAVPAMVTARADYQNFRKFETKAGLIIK